MKQTWGEALLSADRKKELWKGVDVPSNCKPLVAPKLNTKVYIRVNENMQTKDKGAVERQKSVSRSAIPTLYALGDVGQADTKLGGITKYASFVPKDLAEAQKCIKLMGQRATEVQKHTQAVKTNLERSLKIMNYSFTATTRKRKQDICAALGRGFSAYSQDTKTSSENLFTDEVMKAMKAELNQIKPKGQDYYQKDGASKNSSYSGKSQRGSKNQGYNNKYPQQSRQQSNDYRGYNNSNSSRGSSTNSRGRGSSRGR